MKTTLSIFVTLLLTFYAHGQIITTIAGSSGTSLGDGGPATNASLIGPYDVALDGKGNYYITDGYHDRIRKVDSAGTITTVAGSGMTGYNGDNIPATTAMLDRPVGLVVDRHGNIYFSDAYNNRVRKVDTAGIITTVAGNGNTLYNGDNIAADTAAISDPHFLALDESGNLYITEYGGHRIRKVNAAGIITTIAGNGVAGYTGDNGPATAARINTPYGIVLDSGSIIFSDAQEDVVRKIDASGIITTMVGDPMATTPGDDGPATAARLNGPIGVALDAAGNLYIGDASYYRVRRVDRYTRIISTIAGTGTLGFSGDGGPATNAKVSQPAGLAFDTSGNLYIADFGNFRIRLIHNAALSAGSPSMSATSISAFPNPSSGLFTIMVRSTESLPLRYTLTDMLGTAVATAYGNTNMPARFQVSVPAGNYYMRCASPRAVAGVVISITR